MKKILSLILAVLMITSTMTFVVPVTAAETNGVIAKINELASLLGEEYFTEKNIKCTNSGKCSTHSCCHNTTTMKSEWFKQLFGGEDLSALFPTSSAYKHYYPSNNKGAPSGTQGGWSCHGFSTFAFWYIFGYKQNTDISFGMEYVVTTKEDSTAKLNKATLQKYAKPGDLIRFTQANGSGGHSVIFVSCSDNYFTVLDCNWDTYCSVSLHNIYFTNTKWIGGNIAITRAANYDEIANATSSGNNNFTGDTNVTTPSWYSFYDGIKTGVDVKIADLVNKFDYKYFTTEQGKGTCTGVHCDECYNVNIVKSEWMTDLLGTAVSPTQFPWQFYPNDTTSPIGSQGGYNDHGFAIFALWYIFAQSVSSSVTCEYVITHANNDTAHFNYETLSKYARPGDLIRIHPTNTANSVGHSVILVTLDEEGATVIDCNYLLNGDKNNRVRKHKILFDEINSFGVTWESCEIAITRASNYDEVFNSFSCPLSKMQYKYHRYTYVDGGETKYHVCGGAANRTFEETDWMDERLAIDTSTWNYYQHGRVAACSTYGCKDVTTKYMYKHAGNADWPGYWYYEETQLVPVDLTVIFNANGGTTPTASKSVTCGSTYGTLPTPTRTGYTFAGWYTAASGGTKVTSSTAVSITANQTLYAHWTPQIYTVTLNPTGGTLLLTSKQVTYGSTYGTLPNPDRPGYIFDGWYTSASGGTKITSETVVSITANQTLYARWVARTFSIIYDANGGTNAPASQTKTFDVVLKLTDAAPTRTGYTFKGWALSASRTDVSYSPGGNFSTNKDTTLYAVWNANKYTVTFNANGGTTPTASKAVTYASTYGTLPTPTYEGYTFDGWYTAKTGGTKVTSSTAVSITANQTLYAHWTTNSYTIEFDATGGTTPTASKDVTFGSTYGTLPTPTRTGYTFGGWYTAKSGGKEITSTSTVEAPGNHTLYANWKANTYTITLDPNDGSESYTQTVTFGSPYGDAVTNMTAECYKFDGWYTAKTGGTEATVETIVSTASNHTLYARWIPIAATNIYFDEETIEIDIGENYALWLYVEPKNCGEEITFEASSSSITYEYEYLRENSNASVYQIVISAKTVGTYNFKATVGNKTTNCTVKVNSSAVYVTGVSLNKTTATMTKGETLTLTATVAPTNATNKNVTWSSSNTSVATVSNGVVTAKSAGTTTITATTVDGAKTATCVVTVNEATIVDADVIYTIGSASSKPGSTIELALSVSSDVTVNGLLLDNLSYDENALEFVGFAEYGDLITTSALGANGVDSAKGEIALGYTEAVKPNGEICIIKFRVKDTAEDGEYTISIDGAASVNGQKLPSKVDSGKITVSKWKSGDFDSDEKLDMKDVVYFMNWINFSWTGKYPMVYDGDKDFNNDGNVDMKDVVYFMNWVNFSWTGNYDINW